MNAGSCAPARSVARRAMSAANSSSARRCLPVTSTGGAAERSRRGRCSRTATTSSRSSDVRPIPRAGAPMARRKATSSSGFTISRRYARTSLISLRS